MRSPQRTPSQSSSYRKPVKWPVSPLKIASTRSRTVSISSCSPPIARMISSGSQIAVERDNDKNPVVALREIAEQAISPEDLKEELVHSLQKYVEVDEPEPETVPLIGAPGT